MPPDPSRAPLKEQKLGSAEREALSKVSATAGVEGARAQYLLGLDEAANGAWAQAGARWQRLVKERPGTGWDRLAQFKTAEALEKVEDLPRAFVQYQGLLTGTAVADLPERAKAACARLIGGIDAEGLRSLQGYAAEEFQSPLRLRLLELDVAAGRTETARAGLDDYLKRFPTGPGLDRIELLSRSLEASVPVDLKAIGLLVPTGGSLAPFGAQVRQGVELALATANASRAEADRFRLVVADEGGSSLSAVEAARSLVEKDKVAALLGPLGSDAAAALLPLLSARRVLLFSPSAARTDLADASPWFFRNTLTPEKQAVAMADHVVTARRLTRVASLVPDSPYGHALAHAFAKRMEELGGSVAVAVTYAPGTRDFRSAMLALGGTDPGEAKNAEMDEKRDQVAKVEEASNALGRFLLDQAEGLTPPAGVTTTPKLKLLVLDFAQDAASAQLNAGRAFADRFSRTLDQLPELEVQGPQAAEKLWKDKGPSPDSMTLPQLAELGQRAGVDFVLAGGSAELVSGPASAGLPSKRRNFAVAAQLVDPRKSEVAAVRRFTWTKYKPPPPNPLGLQALYLPAPAEDVTRVAPGLVFFDLHLPLLGSDQWDRNELKEHLAELEGAVFTAAYWADSPDPVVKAFDLAYRKAYAARPGLLAAQAYDAATLVLGRLSAGASDRAALRAALAGISGYDGVSGRCGFDGHQDAVKRPSLVGISHGALNLLKER